LQEVPREQRCVVHRAPPEDGVACTALPPLQVGRAFQRGLFDLLVDQDVARSISREHFQIWAEEVAPLQQAPGNRIACTFFLANLSCNGTHVNDDHLQGQGEQSVLRHGDIITLSRPVAGVGGTYQSKFIQFRFDLSESCLRDAEWVESDASPRSEEGTWTGSEGEQQQQDSMNNSGYGQYCEGDLVFVLEVCGPGVHDHVPLERRRIAYAPPPEADLYSSLVIGRAHQLDFWQEVLQKDAFTALSRQHFEVQTWRGTCATRFSFLMHHLSDVNPLHVRSGPKETADAPAALCKGEQRHLLDGDEIVLNLNRDHTFWLIFRDLTESTSIPVNTPPRDERLQAGLGEFRHSVLGPPGGTRESSSAGKPEQPLRTHASVLRPPVSFLLADEDEISTAATPHDLRQEEEEDNDDDVGAGCVVRCGSPSAPARAPSAGGFPHRGRDSDGRVAAPDAGGVLAHKAVGAVTGMGGPFGHERGAGGFARPAAARSRAGSPSSCERPSGDPAPANAAAAVIARGRPGSPLAGRERDARGVRTMREAGATGPLAGATTWERDGRGVCTAACPRALAPTFVHNGRRDARGVREDHGSVGAVVHSAV